MNRPAELTNREHEVAELCAWGACKKEIANHLCISVRTVENHLRNIYEKIGCNKATELSAWYFCSRFKIPMTLSPIARRTLSILLIVIYSYGFSAGATDNIRIRTNSNRVTVRARSSRSRRNEKNYQITYAA